MKALSRRIGGAIPAVVALVTLVGCAGDGASSPEQGTLTIANAAEPASFDPVQAQEGAPMSYFQTVYDTLIRRDSEGNLRPMLAKEWSYNDGNTVLTLHLRDDVTFSDGAAFNAEAAKANLDHFRKANGPQGFTLAGVTSIDVVDEDTITISLSAPDPALLTYLSNAAGLMGSPAALGTDKIKTDPVGSGPYTLDLARTTPGSEYSLVKRKSYWSPELQKYDRVVIRVLGDVTARYNALVSGQVQAAGLDAKRAQQADGQGLADNSHSLDWRGLVIADRDGEIVPALADRRVRQAINHALDGAAMLDSIERGRGTLTNQIFGPGTTAYVKQLDSYYGYNVQKAKELMADAGYAKGFSVDFPAIEGFDPALWPVIEQSLGAIGITVKMIPIQGADVITELQAKKFPIFYMSIFQPDTWVTVNQNVAPSALWNPFHTRRPEVDKLIHQIQFAPDADAQRAPAQKLNTYLVEQAWFAPVYRPDNMIYSSSSVIVQPQPQQAFPSIYNFAPAK